MTGRERLTSILERKPVDRLAWTTLVDEKTRSVMPEQVRDLRNYAFCRHLGCDIMQFGNYDLAPDQRVPLPYNVVGPDVTVETETTEDGCKTTRTHTPWGTLTSMSRSGHPVEYPIQTHDELCVLVRIWQNTRVDEIDADQETFCRAEPAIGDDGIYIPTVSASPVQRLIQIDMGAAAFYYLLQDYPREMEELMATMHACRRVEYEILARRTPAPAIMPVENTSTTLVSPAIYRKYSLPHIRDCADIAHRHGKKVILHMCGHLRNLLPVIAETGFDGVNALTPPTVGDLHFEQALDMLGDDLIIYGGIMDPGLFHKPGVTPDEIYRYLDSIYTPRLRRANFLLWLPADGQPLRLEPFLAVRDWMARNGEL